MIKILMLHYFWYSAIKLALQWLGILLNKAIEVIDIVANSTLFCLIARCFEKFLLKTMGNKRIKSLILYLIV